MYKTFINLSTPGLGPLSIRLQNNINWKQILNLGEYHGTFMIIYENLKKIEFKNVPGNVEEEMEILSKKSFIKTMALDHELFTLLPIFKKNSVSVIVLKGITIAQYYPEQGLRDYSDLDLLIKKDDLPKVEKILLGINYKHLYNFETVQHHKMYRGEVSFIRITPPIVETEIHWNIINSSSLQKVTDLNLSEFWNCKETIKIGDGEVDVFMPEYQFLSLCVHLAFQHQFDRLIWLCDILVLLNTNKSKYDWDIIVNKAKEYKIEIAVYYTFFLLQDIFGEQIPVIIRKNLLPARLIHKIYPFVCSSRHLVQRPSRIRKFRLAFIREGLKKSYDTNKA